MDNKKAKAFYYDKHIVSGSGAMPTAPLPRFLERSAALQKRPG
jgi:hypothetical protein